MSNPLDPDAFRDLRDQSEKILKAVTSPEFLAQLEFVRNAPPGERLVEASNRLTPDALRAAGVDIPSGVRISSRYFEDGSDTSIELADTLSGTNIVNALNATRPGLLDDLRLRNPDVFRRIVSEPHSVRDNAGLCVCVGGAGVCVGIGG